MIGKLFQMMRSVAILRRAFIGRQLGWEDAYNKYASHLADWLRNIIDTDKTHALYPALLEVSEFFKQPVIDPEIGSQTDGRSAAYTDFGMAMLTHLEGIPGHKADYRDLVECFSPAPGEKK